MNVILDASPLGIGFYHRQAQTGVSRVVEKLVTGLHQAAGVDLFLAAPTHLPETMRYAAETFGNATPSFVNAPGEQRIARFENTLLRPFGIKTVPSKVIRQVAYRTRKALHREQARLHVARFPEQAVYHSPFYPIPAAVQSLPTLLTVYDLIPIRHPEWFLDGENAVKRAIDILPATAWVTAVSEATKADFCDYSGFDPARVVPIHLAASPTLFHPVTDEAQQRAVRQRLGVGEGPYLLSLATLEPRKNIDHLIRCFGQLVESRELPDEVKLVLVGTKGWKFDGIMAEVERTPGLRSRLIFTGFVQDKDLAPLYSGATAFVYPSLYEGFGLPPLEAMQCGLPVITSNTSSLPEVVGDAALLVSPTDTDALCQAMLAVVNSPAIRAELSAKALLRATQFSWDKFIAEHVALYKRMLS